MQKKISSSVQPNMENKGFTLIEILISISVGLIILGAIYASINMGQRSSVSVERKVAAQQDARAALELMALEIGMASYNPSYTTGIWRDGPSGTCGNTSSNQTYKGIQEATANSITVEMDIGNIVGIQNDANEIIRYNYDQANQYITRSTNCGGANAFLGAQTGNPRETRIVNGSAGISLFRYYNGDGTELVPGTDLPSDIPDIRRIAITIVAETEEVDANLKQRRRMIYSTSVIPRNHAIN